MLYPTDEMKNAVAILYAHIIKFLQRAGAWFEQGKLKHVVSAITNPYAIRFKDIVEEIEMCARNVDQLAVSSSMAEQRDIHLEQQRQLEIITELRKVIDGEILAIHD